MRLALGLILLLVLVLAWPYNLYRLVTECDFEPAYKCEVVRGIGVALPPVAILTAYFDIGEETDNED